MSRLDPKLIPATPEGRRAEAVADKDYRVAILERSPNVGGGGSVDLTPFVRKDTVLSKGDLLVATGSATLVRLPVGTQNGMVLTVDDSTSTGLAWATITTVPSPSYTISNAVTDLVLNCNSTTLHELADVFASIVAGYITSSIPTFTITNGSIDRGVDCNSTSLHEMADWCYTLYSDLSGATSGAWTVSNLTVSRSYDANSTTEHALSDVIGSFVLDLQVIGDLL